MDKAALRELAEKATPGPWKKRSTQFDTAGFVQGPPVQGMPYSAEILGDDYTGFGGDDAKANDVAFVAAANPQTILALLDEIQSLTEDRTAWRTTAENAEAELVNARAAVQAYVPDGMVLMNAGALNMIINVLRRDANEGRTVRGEMADEILLSTIQKG